MPRIPQRPIAKESYISGFQLATPRVTDIGVAKARPTRVTGTGENIIAGVMKDVSQALGDVADYFAVKEENIRVAKSQHLQMDVNASSDCFVCQERDCTLPHSWKDIYLPYGAHYQLPTDPGVTKPITLQFVNLMVHHQLIKICSHNAENFFRLS